jgi:hypothetical protein
MSSYYISSFIDIIHYLSDSLVQCDAGTKIAELFGEEFDDVDFEMAMCCFEATHRLAFREELIDIPINHYEDLSLEEFLEAYLNLSEQKDPLFVAQRFRMFEEALTRAIADEQSGGDDFQP